MTDPNRGGAGEVDAPDPLEVLLRRHAKSHRKEARKHKGMRATELFKRISHQTIAELMSESADEIDRLRNALEQSEQARDRAESIMWSACVMLTDGGESLLQSVHRAYTLMFDFLHTDIDADAIATPEKES